MYEWLHHLCYKTSPLSKISNWYIMAWRSWCYYSSLSQKTCSKTSWTHHLGKETNNVHKRVADYVFFDKRNSEKSRNFQVENSLRKRSYEPSILGTILGIHVTKIQHEIRKDDTATYITVFLFTTRDHFVTRDDQLSFVFCRKQPVTR